MNLIKRENFGIGYYNQQFFDCLDKYLENNNLNAVEESSLEDLLLSNHTVFMAFDLIGFSTTDSLAQAEMFYQITTVKLRRKKELIEEDLLDKFSPLKLNVFDFKSYETHCSLGIEFLTNSLTILKSVYYNIENKDTQLFLYKSGELYHWDGRVFDPKDFKFLLKDIQWLLKNKIFDEITPSYFKEQEIIFMKTLKLQK